MNPDTAEPSSRAGGKLILKFHVSLDGFIAGPDGELEWVFPDIDDELQAWEVEHLWQASVHIMGRKVYEEMAAYWPNSTEPYAAPMNEIPKVVFSKTLTEPPWGETRVLDGDLSAEIERLKADTPGILFVHGGGDFAQSLIRLDLVEEYRLLVHPIALGDGKRCFASPVNLRLSECRTFPSGVVLLIYHRKAAGNRAAKTGSSSDD